MLCWIRSCKVFCLPAWSKGDSSRVLHGIKPDGKVVVVREFHVQGDPFWQAWRGFGRLEAFQDVDHGKVDRLNVDKDAHVLNDSRVVTLTDCDVHDASARHLYTKSVNWLKIPSRPHYFYT